MRRRMHTDATKHRLVAKAAKVGNVQQVADDAKIAGSVLRLWIKDPRYNPFLSVRDRTGGKKAVATIPQEKAPVNRKARPLVPTKFSCPWCGGPITKEAT